MMLREPAENKDPSDIVTVVRRTRGVRLDCSVISARQDMIPTKIAPCLVDKQSSNPATYLYECDSALSFPIS